MKATLAAIALAAVAAAQPIRLHPDNPHYFLFEKKPAVLITSGEHYGALLNLDFDYVRYFDTLRADRLNLTRVFSGSYREVPGDFSIDRNTLAPQPGKYIAPWAQIGGRFDLTRWDDRYFARLKDLVKQAGRRGIVVEFVLFCPLYRESMWNASPMNAKNNVNSVGKVGFNEVLGFQEPELVKVQEALTRKLVTELRDFDNLYYEVINEPYARKVTLEWQDHIAKVIAETEAGFRKKHMIAYNWSNGSKVVDRPNPLVSLYNFHYSRPPLSVGMNWKLNRAIGNNETGFDGQTDAAYRIQGWDFMLAGGALYNNLDYSFTVGHEDGSYAYNKATPGGGSKALRRQLRYLRDFFDAIPFVRMQPVEGVVAGPEGASVRVLAEAGKTYAVYVHHGRKGGNAEYLVDAASVAREFGLRLSPGAYTVEWRDPKTGAVLGKQDITAAEGFRLTSPAYSEDVALLIRRAGR